MTDPRVKECRQGLARIDSDLAQLNVSRDYNEVRDLSARRLALANFLEAQGEPVPAAPVHW